MLLRNYRSHSRLLELPSRLFYSHSLVASASREAVQAPAWSELTAPHLHDDAAGSHIDLADAPAKGYLETLLEELTRSNHGKPAGRAHVSESSGDNSQVTMQNGVGETLDASPGKWQEASNRTADEGHAAVDGSREGHINGDLHGVDSGRGELEALAQEYADGEGEDVGSTHGQAEADDFEEQLPTNTLFYGVAGKQVGVKSRQPDCEIAESLSMRLFGTLVVLLIQTVSPVVRLPCGDWQEWLEFHGNYVIDALLPIHFVQFCETLASSSVLMVAPPAKRQAERWESAEPTLQTCLCYCLILIG